MIMSLRTRRVLAVLAWIPAAAQAAPAESKQSFSLGQYIPNDCFVYAHGVHNPERDFIDQHWSRVFKALKQTGIGDEIKSLILSGAPPERRAEIEKGWDHALHLIDGVRWGELVGREFAFAERMTHVFPEVIVLCRSTPDSVEPNVAGLKAIFDQIATLAQISVTESAIGDAKVWRLSGADWPFGVFLLRKDDVVGLVLGEKATTQIAKLLSGDDAKGSMVQNPRFKEAMRDLPAPEDEVFFIDIKLMLSNFDGMFEAAFKKHGHGPGGDAPALPPPDSGDVAAMRIISKVVDQFDFVDYVASVSRTEGLQTFTDSRVRIQSKCTQKSLCKMFTSQKPFERFDKYVPKEATGFNVWDGVNLKELYRAVLDFIKNDVPEGPELLSKWTQVQQDIGFDVEADLLSWWSGEMVSVSLPPAVMTPFTNADSVVFIRVKDPAVAAAKVNAGIDRVAALAKEYNQALIIQDVTDVRAEGFRSVTHPMVAMMGRLIIGVTDNHLVLGSSPQAINKCLDTAAGKAPSIVESPRFKAEGIMPKGPVTSASFTDLSNMGQEMAAAFFSIGFVNAFIPEQPETKPIKAIFGMLGKLSTAIQEINFYSSSSSVCEFDGQSWLSRDVITYKPPQAESTGVAQKSE